MIASWHATPMCGPQLWQILVTSPEVLIFALFMVPDPRTVPDGQAARFVFGVIVAAAVRSSCSGRPRSSSGPRPRSSASLVIACAGRFAPGAFPRAARRGRRAARARCAGWAGVRPAALGVSLMLLRCAPDVFRAFATHGPIARAELPDGTPPTADADGRRRHRTSACGRSARPAQALPPPGGTHAGRGVVARLDPACDPDGDSARRTSPTSTRRSPSQVATRWRTTPCSTS